MNAGYGLIEGAQPAGLPKALTGIRNLNTRDIGGAQTNTRNKGCFTWVDRKDVREINQTKDIQGCQADTLKRGFIGEQRNVNNPLTPSYFYPGGAENIDLQNDPFGHKTCSMSKANFKKASEQGV